MAAQPSGIDGTRVVVALITAVAVSMILTGWIGAAAIAPLGLTAIALGVASVRVVAAQDRVRDPSRHAAWGSA